MARPQKTLKFKEENMDVYNILCEQDNYTQFVCDAVRFYKNKQGPSTTTKDGVLEEIRDYLRRIEGSIHNSPGNQTSTNLKNPMVDDQLIKQILNEDD